MFTILDEIEYIGDNFCDTNGVLSVLRLVGYVLFLLKIFIPIIIIYVETINFLGAVKDGSSDAVTKHTKRLIIRVAVGIIIIFIPTILHAILNSFIPADSKNCEVCLLKPFSCDTGDSGGIDVSEKTTKKTTTTVKNTPTVEDKITECDGYYNKTEEICIKKEELACKYFEEKSSCNSAESKYGIACTYDDVDYMCKEKTDEEETVIKPSGSGITDINNFPDDALACSLRGEATCDGNCKWTGSSCRSNIKVSDEIISDLCKIAKTHTSGVDALKDIESERDRCNSIDEYCTYQDGVGCIKPTGGE